MKALTHRLLAIRGLGPLRRLVYRLVTSSSFLNTLPTRLHVHLLADSRIQWCSIDSWNRDALLSVAAKTQSVSVREFIFRLLVRRQNFISALVALNFGERGKYELGTQLDALHVGYSAVSGEESDRLLAELFADGGAPLAGLPVKQFGVVCDSIRNSGLEFAEKVVMLDALRSRGLAGARLRAWTGVNVDVRRRVGEEVETGAAVDSIFDSQSVSDADVDMVRAVWAVARETISRARTIDFMKRALGSKDVTIRNVPFLLRELPTQRYSTSYPKLICSIG